MRALAEGLAQVSLTVIATRGKRLSLARVRSFNPDSRREGFAVELLGIAEIDTDGRIAAHVFSTPTISMLPSRNSMRATSPAKRPRTRTLGR